MSFVERLAGLELYGAKVALATTAAIPFTPLPFESMIVAFTVTCSLVALVNLVDFNRMPIAPFFRVPYQIISKITHWSLNVLHQLFKLRYVALEISLASLLVLATLMLMCQPLRIVGMSAPHEFTWKIASGAFAAIPAVINYPFNFIKGHINSRTTNTMAE